MIFFGELLCNRLKLKASVPSEAAIEDWRLIDYCLFYSLIIAYPSSKRFVKIAIGRIIQMQNGTPSEAQHTDRWRIIE